MCIKTCLCAEGGFLIALCAYPHTAGVKTRDITQLLNCYLQVSPTAGAVLMEERTPSSATAICTYTHCSGQEGPRSILCRSTRRGIAEGQTGGQTGGQMGETSGRQGSGLARWRTGGRRLLLSAMMNQRGFLFSAFFLEDELGCPLNCSYKCCFVVVGLMFARWMTSIFPPALSSEFSELTGHYTALLRYESNNCWRDALQRLHLLLQTVMRY